MYSAGRDALICLVRSAARGYIVKASHQCSLSRGGRYAAPGATLDKDRLRELQAQLPAKIATLQGIAAQRRLL